MQWLKDLQSYNCQTLIFKGLQRSECNFKNNWKEYVKQNFKNRKLHSLLRVFFLARKPLIIRAFNEQSLIEKIHKIHYFHKIMHTFYNIYMMFQNIHPS